MFGMQRGKLHDEEVHGWKHLVRMLGKQLINGQKSDNEVNLIILQSTCQLWR